MLLRSERKETEIKNLCWCAHCFLNCGLTLLQAGTCAGIRFLFFGSAILNYGTTRLRFWALPSKAALQPNGSDFLGSGSASLETQLEQIHTPCSGAGLTACAESISAAHVHSTHGLQHPQDTIDFWSEFPIQLWTSHALVSSSAGWGLYCWNEWRLKSLMFVICVDILSGEAGTIEVQINCCDCLVFQ